MDYRVIISPSGREDLKELVSYIAQENPAAAEKMGNRILSEIKKVGDFPEMGRMVPEFKDPDIREIIVYPFRVIYRVNKASGFPEVVRIWRGFRGHPKL